MLSCVSLLEYGKGYGTEIDCENVLFRWTSRFEYEELLLARPLRWTIGFDD